MGRMKWAGRMWKSVIAVAVFGLAAMPARAGVVCATPQELKVLQSAALQQQLMVAALSCHMSADYNRFVTAYRTRLVQSDEALKAFFAGRPRGEDYNAYKTRIANRVSLRSARDARFCESAQKVFDMALGRGEERRGLVPEPPQLIDTGYEGCRPVDDNKLIEAEAAPPRPEKTGVIAAATPKPAPTTRVQVAALPSATVALKLAPRPLIAPAPKHLTVIAPGPAAIALNPAAAPKSVAVTAGPKPAPLAKPTVLPPRRARPPRPDADVPEAAPSERFADEDTDRLGGGDEVDTQGYDAAPPQRPAAESPRRYAAVERPSWRPRAARPDDDQVTDDHVPNAYRPGVVWVGDAGPDWRPAAYDPPPRGRHPPPHAHRVVGPDGRWMVVIGGQPSWMRD